MFNSREVLSNQQLSIHHKLVEVVQKHLACPYEKPFQEHNIKAFDRIQQMLERHGGPLIFDSGCGTGESTLALAAEHPSAFVVGIDKSVVRLRKHSLLEDSQDTAAEDRKKPVQYRGTNVALVRANVVDIWRLAEQAGWKLQRHYLLYPNPWPKKEQLKRRWHAHPVFPSLLALGGILEVRSNWKTYLDEFSLAFSLATSQAFPVEEFLPEESLSPFEKKYAASDHRLFRFIASCEAKGMMLQVSESESKTSFASPRMI